MIEGELTSVDSKRAIRFSRQTAAKKSSWTGCRQLAGVKFHQIFELALALKVNFTPQCTPISFFRHPRRFSASHIDAVAIFGGLLHTGHWPWYRIARAIKEMVRTCGRIEGVREICQLSANVPQCMKGFQPDVVTGIVWTNSFRRTFRVWRRVLQFLCTEDLRCSAPIKMCSNLDCCVECRCESSVAPFELNSKAF